MQIIKSNLIVVYEVLGTKEKEMANLGEEKAFKKKCVKKAVLETGFLKTAVEDKPRK